VHYFPHCCTTSLVVVVARAPTQCACIAQLSTEDGKTEIYQLYAGSWSWQHDTCKLAMHQAAVTAGLHSKVEVAGLFAAMVPVVADGSDRL
jgi:hypothetical protein